MSSLALARKWRPQYFSDVVGQEHALKALSYALDQQRLHHAYLFSGTRGVGKTTIARLFAKSLNCEQGISSSPCGVCSSCVEIADGRFVDLIEIDAASRTKVDDTREILNNAQYLPTRGRYKVYLIDEVHMLSRSSFNALLKTLEEPPEHVKFILATTEPKKLPITVLSRCFHVNLTFLNQELIQKQLAHILTNEMILFEEASLPLLARAAQGSMRDALSLTDQAIAQGAGHVTLETVQHMLGLLDADSITACLETLIHGDAKQMLATVQRVLNQGADGDALLAGLLERLHTIHLARVVPDVAVSSEHQDAILRAASIMSVQQIQFYYKTILQGRKDLPFAPDTSSGIEITLLRIIAAVAKRKKSTPSMSSEQPVTPSASAQVTDEPVDDDNNSDLQAQLSMIQQQAESIRTASDSKKTVRPETSAPVAVTMDETQESGLNEADCHAITHYRENVETPSSITTATERETTQEITSSDAVIDDVLAMRQSLMNDVRQYRQNQFGQSHREAPKTETIAQQETQSLSLDAMFEQTDKARAKKKVIDEANKSPSPMIEESHQSSSTMLHCDESWFRLVTQLPVGGRSKQLAIHSVCDKHGRDWTLWLKPEQRHLVNEVVIHDLQQALSQQEKLSVSLDVQVKQCETRLTPSQVKQKLHAQCVEKAQTYLLKDDNVQQLMRECDARLDISSVEYPQAWIDESTL